MAEHLMPFISLMYGSFLLLLFTVLSINVSRVRGTFQVWSGDGGHEPLRRAIRVQGNMSEYVGITLLSLALCELCGGRSFALHILGGGFLLARLLQVGALFDIKGVSVVGSALTYLTLLGLAGYGLLLRFM
jgi:uncharacterized protein